MVGQDRSEKEEYDIRRNGKQKNLLYLIYSVVAKENLCESIYVWIKQHGFGDCGAVLNLQIQA